jgi:hypothetical protein
MTKLWGLVVLICGGCAVALGVFFWAVASTEAAEYGLGTAAVGVGIAFLGGLLMWIGKDAPPPSTGPGRPAKGTTDLSAASTIVDGVFDLLR